MDKIGCGASKHVYKAFDEVEGIEVAWNEVYCTGEFLLPQSEAAVSPQTYTSSSVQVTAVCHS